MRLRELKKLTRVCAPTANIISDGCRDYVVEIYQPSGAGILKDRSNRPMRFHSLDAAKRTLRRARVENITLRVRVAADEACFGDPISQTVGGFSQLALCRAETSTH